MAFPNPPIINKIPQVIRDWYIFIVIFFFAIGIILAGLKLAGVIN